MQGEDSRGTRTFEPGSLEEVCDALRSTGERVVATVGSGTALGLGNPATREDVTLRTHKLDRVVDYAPEDQVVVVEAGIALGELQVALAKHGQRLAIESLHGDDATIGGMLATNDYGAGALRYGTLKDLIVGIEIVRADGVIAHAGGKVVKNVAGFDVSKLMVGSLGTLAIITKATFRVHPLPESTRRVSFSAKTDRVFPFVLALREAQLEPASIAARISGDDATIDVLFEGFGPGVDAQSAACNNVAARAGLREGVVPREVEEQPKFTLKATFPPNELTRVAREIGGRGLAFPSLGVVHFGDAPTSLGLRTEGVTTLRAFFEAMDGTLVVQRMPEEWRGKIDAWGIPPPAFAIMRALKERFDPQHRLNPGRFVGGL